MNSNCLVKKSLGGKYLWQNGERSSQDEAAGMLPVPMSTTQQSVINMLPPFLPDRSDHEVMLLVAAFVVIVTTGIYLEFGDDASSQHQNNHA